MPDFAGELRYFSASQQFYHQQTTLNGGRSRGVLSAKELATERGLIEDAQRDPRRFARLYERYFDLVYGFALTRTRDKAAAEDVTAQAFLRALQHLPEFQWRGVPFSAWLLRIAANAAIDLGKRAARQARLEDAAEACVDSWEDYLIEVEEHVLVFQLVRRLPRDQQRVIAMRFGQGRSIVQIAQTLGRSEAAVKQLQYRAIQNLRNLIGEDHD